MAGIDIQMIAPDLRFLFQGYINLYLKMCFADVLSQTRSKLSLAIKEYNHSKQGFEIELFFTYAIFLSEKNQQKKKYTFSAMS